MTALPARVVLPWMDPALDRCKGQSAAGSQHALRGRMI
jgi:hypothetical protein